jgi:hypothetical protein
MKRNAGAFHEFEISSLIAGASGCVGIVRPRAGTFFSGSGFQ